MADLYSRLGVARGATDADIKKGYRKLAKELHPDRNKDNPKAADRFSEVTQAYDLLSDKDKRAQYDRGEIDENGQPKFAGFGGAGGGSPFGRGGGGFRQGPGGTTFEFNDAASGGADFGDIFEGLFGGGGGGSGGGRGGGGGPFGRGGRRAAARGADIAYRLAVDFDEAAALKPQRVTLQNGKTIDLKLTADAVAGTPLRLSGQGEDGPGGKGDAIVTVEVKPHRFFTRDGDDVRLDLPVSLDEAVLGGKVPVPTVEGTVTLTVPKGSSSGKVLRLRGRGFHRKSGERGDQYVTLLIDLPPEDEALAAFAEELRARSTRNPRAPLNV